MSVVASGRPVGKYVEVNGEWVYAFHLPELSGAETMTIRTDGFEGKYVKVGDDWVYAAALVGDDGNLLDVSDAHITALAEAAIGFLPVVTSFSGSITGTTGTLTANTAYGFRFRVAKRTMFSKITVKHGATVAGNLDAGLYEWDGATTWTRVASSGSIAAAGVNDVQALAFTAPYECLPDVDYFGEVVSDSATHTLIRLSASSAAGVGLLSVSKGSVNLPLPATIEGMTGSAVTVWMAVE